MVGMTVVPVACDTQGNVDLADLQRKCEQHGDKLREMSAGWKDKLVQGMLDAYAYRPLVWGIGVETASKPRRGEKSDDASVASAFEVA